MPLLCVKIECLRTRCGECDHLDHGVCRIFKCAVRLRDGNPLRLQECKAAEERGKLPQAIRAIAARSGVV